MNVVRRLAGLQEIGVLLALLILGTILAFTTDTFFTTLNLFKVARQASTYGILAVGMVFVLSMGEVDLSVGSIVTLTNIVAALALKDKLPIGIALGIAMVTGTLCGVLNGLLTVALRIPTIIVTLGTLSI